MKISVIIPMYNAKQTIANTLLSVVKQTYQEPFEIIIINDGSDDGCEEIVKEHISTNKTNRMITLINQKNAGVSAARNKGIYEAKGEYIAFLDSDDMWHPQKLEIILEVLEDDSINMIGHNYTLDNNFSDTFQKCAMKEIKFMQLLLKNFAVTPSIVIKRDICQYFNEEMRYTEDHELWLRMALKNSIYYCDLPLVTLGREELSKGGLSANRWAMRKGELGMYAKLYKISLWFLPMIPFLYIFSLLKHLLQFLKRR